MPAGDVPALQAALTRLLGDAELRARLGRTARRHAETRFDLDVQARKLVEVYRALAGVHGDGSRLPSGQDVATDVEKLA